MNMAVDRKRGYRLRERARKQEETRRRITAATVALHEEVGAARTTIKAIAERAGVERLTVYRHFPDEAALLDACSAHWIAAHPPPDPYGWTEPRAALRALYAYYGANERMLANNFRDREAMPALDVHMQGFDGFLDGVAAMLAGRRGKRHRAALRH